jgi:phosphoribosylglycinamide formyltransferase-1
MAVAPPPADEDPRLTRLSALCLSLPEAARELQAGHAMFRVRARTFAYFLDDHHGDGKVALTVKVAPGENAELVATDSTRFFLPSYIGPKGWVALRLDAGEPDWVEVAELVTDSYRLVAPKRLAAAAELPPGPA